MMTSVFAALDIRLDVEIKKEACDDDAVDEIGGRERFRERASGRHYVYYRVEHDSEKLDLKCRIFRYLTNQLTTFPLVSYQLHLGYVLLPPEVLLNGWSESG